jgi:DNA-binding response OmpR family regulator
MPGMSGLELLSRIKAKHHDPPPMVMMISAYGDSENQKAAMDLGADGFISKPVDFAVLKEKIKALF